MHRASTPVRVIALIASVLLFAIAGGGAFAVADDYLTREVLPEGTTVGGVAVGGLTRAAAVEIVSREVAAPMAEPVTVRYGDRTFALDAASLISIDVEGMVDEALRPRSEAALPERVVQRALGDPAGAAVPVDVAVDHAALEAWVAAVAAEIDTAPVDATMTLSGDRLEVVAARAGKTVDRAAAVAALGEALVTGGKEVPLTVTTTDPAVAEGDLGAAILVDLSERRLYLYRAGAEEKTYGVAIGTASHPTPRGSFRIVQKRYMPSWGNPGSAWAAGMPDYIPPGPSNPLGTRALNLDVSGIRIHGTSNNGSIGTAASHGCMRMHRWDIEDLYERVDVGTPVYIVR